MTDTLATERLTAKRRRIALKLEDPRLAEHVRKHATEVELPMISAALARIADGDYGVCDECGEPIEADRLVAIPEIDTCKDCGFRKDGRVPHRHVDLAVARRIIEALEARKPPDSKVKSARIDETAGTVVFTTDKDAELELPVADFVGLYAQT